MRGWAVWSLLLAAGCSGNPIEAETVGPTGASTSSDTGGVSGSSSEAGSSGTAASSEGVTSRATDGSGDTASSSGPTTTTTSGTTGVAICTPILAEVLYDVGSSSDDGLEWVKLFNPCASAVDLSAFHFAWAGFSYADNGFALSGTIAPNECFLFGGPDSEVRNGFPEFDLEFEFDPPLENSSSTQADGVALFHVADVPSIATAWPLDAVIYGGDNNNGLVDAHGRVGAPHIEDVDAGTSLLRASAADGDWIAEAKPAPNACQLAR